MGIADQTKEELQANGRKGGIRSGQVRAERKKWRDEMSLILSLPISKGDKNKASREANKLLSVDKAKALKDFAGKNTTVQTQIMLKLAQMAMGGNIKAIDMIGSITGDYRQAVDITSASEVKVTNKVDDLADDLFGDDNE